MINIRLPGGLAGCLGQGDDCLINGKGSAQHFPKTRHGRQHCGGELGPMFLWECSMSDAGNFINAFLKLLKPCWIAPGIFQDGSLFLAFPPCQPGA